MFKMCPHILIVENIDLLKADMGMFQSKLREYFCKTLTNIIRVMQNIGFTTSLEITTITSEELVETIDKGYHDPC